MSGDDFVLQQTRRKFFREVSFGLGNIVLAHLLNLDEPMLAAESADPNPLRPRQPHFPSKAKSVIFLFMEGGPSQLDLLDPKPELRRWDGKPLPESLTKDLRLAFIKPTAAVMASRRSFRKYGQCGMDFSEFLPNLATRADDICMIRSMRSDAFNHHPGQLMLFTGTTQVGRPTIGSWVVYGLGSESRNLPGFVVLNSGRGASAGANNWTCGFLPTVYQGTAFRRSGEPIPYLNNPPGVNQRLQRAGLDGLRQLNQAHYEDVGDAEISARIAAYELAFRMQTAAPELLDISSEPKQVLESYGVGKEPTNAFAVNCLLARRMVERGVRFVQLIHAGWDHHNEIERRLEEHCQATDQPAAALLADLKQRGLLENTLVVWGGEFGRTPMVQLDKPQEADTAGRDHHPLAYSMWLAGGGVNGGQVVGRTDELGMTIVEDKIEIHDLQATILHCLGFNHKRLTFRHMGRDFRLTDVAGEVKKKLLA
jgi:hypothetical protein